MFCLLVHRASHGVPLDLLLLREVPRAMFYSRLQATTASVPAPVFTLPSSQPPVPSQWPAASSSPVSPSQQPMTPPAASPAPSTSPPVRAPDFTSLPIVTAAGPTSFDLSFSLSSPGLVRFQIMIPVLYAQTGGVYVSFASVDPAPGQALTIVSVPSPAVLGVNGVVAAGAINITTLLPYTIRVNGSLPDTRSAAAACSCNTQACSCDVAAPCQGQMCDLGPSALTPNTTYKVSPYPPSSWAGTFIPRGLSWRASWSYGTCSCGTTAVCLTCLHAGFRIHQHSGRHG
jgi:hypothetical protein